MSTQRGWNRRTRRRKLLSVVAGLALVSTTMVACGSTGGSEANSEVSSEAKSKDDVVLGTSSVGSNYYNVAVAMADRVTRDGDIRTSVQSVGGSTATLHAIGDGKADLGMSNTFAALEAVAGEGSFEEPLELRLIAQGDQSLRQIVVREDSGIETPADLEGKRIVGERPALPDIRLVTDAVLKVYGVNAESVTVVSAAETAEGLNALKQGSADAMVVPAGAGAANLLELSQTSDVRFLDLSDRMDDLLKELGPAFSRGAVSAGSYEGQSQEFEVPGLVSLLVASPDLPDEQVRTIAESIFDGNEDITQAVPSGRHWTAENTVSGPMLFPFHPGAIEYFESVDLWDDEMAQTQEELLSK